jgi:hypothetical protein
MPSPSRLGQGFARVVLGLLLPLLGLGELGCSRDEPGQIQVVQMLADALDKRSTRRAGSACVLAVAERQDPMSCDNMIVPILHYAPTFPGSKISRRAATSGGYFGRPIKVHVRYERKDGSGSLDVTMRRESNGTWHIFSVFPAP